MWGTIIRYQSIDSDVLWEIDSPASAERLLELNIADNYEDLQHFAYSTAVLKKNNMLVQKQWN